MHAQRFFSCLAVLALMIGCAEQKQPEISVGMTMPTPEVMKPVPAEMPDLAAQFVTLLKERVRHVEQLQAYTAAGKFPKNYHQPGQVPVFIDEHGTHCAVCHLLKQSGQPQLALAIRNANNLVKVMDVKDGPLLDWMLDSGLTQEECARIQPSYRFEREPYISPEQRKTNRIQGHLVRVTGEVEKDTAASLRTALDRQLPRIRTAAKLATLGYKLVPQPQSGTTVALRNPAAIALTVRLATIRPGKAETVAVVHTDTFMMQPGETKAIALTLPEAVPFVQWCHLTEAEVKGIEVLADASGTDAWLTAIYPLRALPQMLRPDQLLQKEIGASKPGRYGQKGD